jgi:phage-related minor tail protein
MRAMSDSLANFSIGVTADTAAAKAQFLELEKLGAQFSTRFASSFERAIFSGKSFGDVLRGLALDLSRLAFRSAVQPLQQAGAGLFDGALGNLLGFARGGVAGGSAPIAFAHGGVLSGPAVFPLGGGGRMGLAGEAGAEAIMPLARGPDGRLGVRAQNGGTPISVTLNISTPDAESFRRSQGQITAMLARATRRGERNL